MGDINTRQIVEALIMASDSPLTIEKIFKILKSENDLLEISELNEVIKNLADSYAESGIELKEVASGWRFQIKSDLSDWVGKLYAEKPPKYSYAFLETLALIAYRQPITRAEIENVRGVAVSSNIIRMLLDHEWVRVVGHKETPGRPALLATTKKFLDHFNLKNLSELPPLIEFTETIKSEVESGDLELQSDEKEAVHVEITDEENHDLSECSTEQSSLDEGFTHGDTESESTSTSEPDNGKVVE